MPSTICLAGFLSLLVIAAVEDVRERRIANWLTLGVAALWPLWVVVSPAPVAWLGALALAAAVLAVGFALFARGWLGGGDVKLIAAVSLWAGPEHMLLFALVTSLAGGVLALATLSWQRLLGPLGLHLQALGLLGGRPAATASEEPAAPATLPYGVAIAAGGVAVALQLMNS
jgi:prepilin peptidase CpaA